jgi:AraC-like DNA-binding protein
MNNRPNIQTPRNRLMDRVHIRLYTIRKNTLTEKSWNLKNLYSSFWRLYMNFRDGATIFTETDTFPLTPKNIHFIPAWQRFSARCDRTLDHFFIHFDIVGLPGTLVRDVFDTPITLHNAPQLVEQAQILAKNGTNQPQLADLFRAKALLYQAMAQLIDQLPEDKARRCQSYALQVEPILPAVQYIDRAYNRSIHNNDLASMCHLSVDYFIRRFKECVDQTPGQYLLERRINAAAQQLVFTHDPIEKIAEDSGFKNRFYFSRMFTRIMGTPPAAYRKVGHV